MQPNGIASAAGGSNATGAVMLGHASCASRRLRAALAALAVAFGVGCWLSAATAHAAATSPFTVARAPTSMVAGSSGNSLRLTFTARYPVQTTVSVVVPTDASWTAPQNSDAARPGYVSAAKGTCSAAAVTAVRDARQIVVATKCAKGQRFRLSYADATAATVAGPYTFTASSAAAGSDVLLSPQPVVTVKPGPTSRLAVTGLADAVGAAQDLTVTAQDRFGNATPRYRGTVRFQGSGPPAAWVDENPPFPGFDRTNGFTLPGDYGFTAADAGAHTFTGGAKISFAGDQTVAATDSDDATITGSQTVTITPGPTAGYGVLEPVLSSQHHLSIIGLQIPRQRLTVAAFDQWGNIATGDNSTLNFTWGNTRRCHRMCSDADFPTDWTLGDLPSTLTLVNGTASHVVTWPTMPSGNVRVLMRISSTNRGTEPAPPTFRRLVEIDLDPPAINAEVITIPPITPDGDQSYQLTLPDQHLFIAGPLTVTDIRWVASGPLVIEVTGVTTGGDQISTSLTLGEPVNADNGLIVDTSIVASTSGNLVIDNQTGDTILQPGSQLQLIDISAPVFEGLAGSVFEHVQTISPNPATFSASSALGLSTQAMVATGVAPATCFDGKTWNGQNCV
jgi:hypothetical protein